MLVLKLILILSIALSPLVRIYIPPPMPIRPFAISRNFNLPIFSMALANISIDLAINTIEAPALSVPLAVNFKRLFTIDLKLKFNIVINPAIARSDLLMSETLNSDIDLRDIERIPTAATMANKLPTFIPATNACKVSPTEFITSANVSFNPFMSDFPPFPPNKLSIMSFILFITPENFLAATNIPPPARPADISPAETFSENHEKALLIPPKIVLSTLLTPFPILDNTSPKPSKPPEAFFIILEIPSNNPVTDLDIPSVLKPELREVKKSPIAAVILSIRSKTPVTPPPENIPPIALLTITRTFLNISKIEKTPLKVLLILSAVSSLTFNFSVKLLIAEVILYNCSDVAGGNISLNASCIGFITSANALKEFLKASITSTRPPMSFQPCSRLFLESADFPIRELTTSLISVSNAFASSKSPIRISHV